MGPLMGLLNAKGRLITESPISPSDLAELLKLMDKKVLSGKIAKTVFDEMAQTGKPPKTIVKEKGWVQVTDETAIKQVVVKVLESYPKEVNDYKNGKTKLLGFFVGQVMKKTQGKANPKMVNDIFKKILNDGRVTSNE
jgi:aspartyl-tRNA(Asn)/glutamyl-tRNA(Gln) amidotransferase subunit B